MNIGGGITTIVVPLLVITRLGYSEALVGVVFALSGVAGMGSALAFGRLDTRGREWRLLVAPMIGIAPAVALLLVPAAVDDIEPAVGLLFLAGWALITGFLNGPMDIALFTIRQRRTDPAWTGRAFAVSMAMNFLGFPIGAAIAGALAEQSLTTAIVPAIAASVLGPRVRGDAGAAHGPRPGARPPGGRRGSCDGAVGRFVCVSLFEMSPKATDDDTASLKRLAGRGWQTRDGRFTIETASGTWSVVDEEQTDDLGLPLVRGPFRSLTEAKAAIEEARTSGAGALDPRETAADRGDDRRAPRKPAPGRRQRRSRPSRASPKSPRSRAGSPSSSPPTAAARPA